MPKNLIFDREGWLLEAAALLCDGVLAPHTTLPIPPYRVSIGFPHRRQRQALACCFARSASADGHSEIFVSPQAHGSLLILASLTHELIHAFDDLQSGHRGHFARLARAAGLVGPLPATRAGPALTPALSEIRGLLGPIPHAKLCLGDGPPDTTRQLRVSCRSCHAIFRMSGRWLRKLTKASPCPVCARAALSFDR